MDSNWSYGGFCREPEGMGIRAGSVFTSPQKRTTSNSRDDNGGGKMTSIKLAIVWGAWGIIAVTAHAVLPSAVKTTDCAPAIECTQKEPIE